MPISIPSFQPIRLIDVPEPGQELARLMTGATSMAKTFSDIQIARERLAMARAAAARRAQEKALGQEMALSNGQRIRVQGFDSKSKRESYNNIVNQLAAQALASNPDFIQGINDMNNASVERQAEILTHLENEVLPNITKDQSVEVNSAIADIMKKQRTDLANRTAEVENDSGFSAIGDAFSSRLRQVGEGIRSFINDETEADKLASAQRINQIAEQTTQENAYLRNLQRREQEGVGTFDRAFSGTGSALTNLGTFIAPQLVDMGADIALPAVGATIGTAVGTPGVGTTAGFLGGMAAAAGLSALTERADYMANVAANENLTDEQRMRALSDAATGSAMTLGAVSGAAGGGIGRGARIVGNLLGSPTRRGIRHMITRDIPEMALEGGAQAAAEQGGQNVIMRASSGADVPLSENVLDAALQGAVTGGLLGIPRNLRHRSATDKTPPISSSGKTPSTDETPAAIADDTEAPQSAGSIFSKATSTMNENEKSQFFANFSSRVRAMNRVDKNSVTRESIETEFVKLGGDINEFEDWRNSAVNGKGNLKISKTLFDKLAPKTESETAATAVEAAPDTTSFEARAQRLASDIRRIRTSKNPDAETYDQISQFVRDGGTVEELDQFYRLIDRDRNKRSGDYAMPSWMVDNYTRAADMIKQRIETDERGVSANDTSVETLVNNRDLPLNDVIRFRDALERTSQVWLTPSQRERTRAQIDRLNQVIEERTNATGQTGSETSATRNETSSVGQPQTNREAGTDNPDNALDSRMASSTEAGTPVASRVDASTTDGNSGTTSSAGIGRPAVQGIRPNQSTQGNVEQTGTGRITTDQVDNGTNNRLASTGGEESNTGTGIAGDSRVGDNGIAGDAETPSERLNADSERLTQPKEAPANTPDMLRQIPDSEAIARDTIPSDPDAAKRNFALRLLDIEWSDADGVWAETLYKEMHSSKLKTFSDMKARLYDILTKEALQRDFPEISGTLKKKERQLLDTLRKAGVPFAEELPPIPEAFINEVKNIRDMGLRVTSDNMVAANANPGESLYRTLINVACRFTV